MSRVKRLRNESKEPVEIKLADGNSVNVAPGGSLENVDVVNLGDVKVMSKITFTRDMTEVVDSSHMHATRKKLYG